MTGVALFLILVANLRFSESHHSALSSYVSTTEGKLLIGNALAQFRDTDPTSCALHCIRRETCGGVNYDLRNEKCSLMAAHGGVLEFETASGFVFMEMLGSHKVVMEGMLQETPAISCKTLKEKHPHVTSGIYWLDPDAGSYANAFRALCDMEMAGGGWTLVWSYTFRDYNNFDSPNNAVTPVPNKWQESYTADVQTSVTIPLEEDQYDATDFQLWKKLGEEFLIKSNINNWLACSPEGGSFVDWITGPVSCQVARVVASSCPDTVPLHFSTDKGISGPILEMEANEATWTSLYYFGVKTTKSWPTHDPCGTDSRKPGVPGVVKPRDNVYLR